MKSFLAAVATGAVIVCTPMYAWASAGCPGREASGDGCSCAHLSSACLPADSENPGATVAYSSAGLVIGDLLMHFEPQYYQSLSEQQKAEYAEEKVADMLSLQLGNPGSSMGSACLLSDPRVGSKGGLCPYIDMATFNPGSMVHVRVLIFDKTTGDLVSNEAYEGLNAISVIGSAVTHPAQRDCTAVAFGYAYTENSYGPVVARCLEFDPQAVQRVQ